MNSCTIHYGIREHALLSRLECRNYQVNYKEAGGMKFARKYFVTGTKRYQDVNAKLQEMEPTCDRLRMLLLYFLSRIIIGQIKTGKDAPSMEPFLLRAFDDLNLCKTFPWGIFSFDHMLKHISHTMEHFGGVVQEGDMANSWFVYSNGGKAFKFYMIHVNDSSLQRNRIYFSDACLCYQ